MKKFYKILLIGLALVLSAWGSAGHFRISEQAALIFTGEMFEFNEWLPYIADHASDADARKQWDNTEGPKHYIDIDNYPVFQSEGKIPQTMDSCIALYGSSFVGEQGTLPWATLATYDTLVACFVRHDWLKAKVTTADLSHYVADGHMPLHITANYNGSGDTYGIHSRYESSMVGRYLSQLFYTPQPYSGINDVRGYIFTYLYRNNRYVDTIMNADLNAQSVAESSSSTLYYELLWEETSYMTKKLFSEATTALVSLVYQAWCDAGKPEFNSLPPVDHTGIRTFETGVEVWPNPFSDRVNISFAGEAGELCHVLIADPAGRIVRDLGTFQLTGGEERIIWQPDQQSAGEYFLLIRTAHQQRVQKLIFNGQ
ncbi:MAG: hypothetical protein ACOYXB_11300 [Bacteroidota bacterium]